MNGVYRLSPMLVHYQRRESWAAWTAQDAWVLKWVALQIAGKLPVHTACTHVRGQGGGRGTVQNVWEALGSSEYRYVYRTDIRGFYRHIKKEQALKIVQRNINDTILVNLIEQYLYYSIEDGGVFYTPETGICRACALSPIIGASLLRHIDGDISSRENVFYQRYMDDFIIFTKTRWQLRHIIKRLNEYFDLGGFEPHPDKTQLGKIQNGFDWMGVWFGSEGATIAPRALENHALIRARLYERARIRHLSSAETENLVRAYEERWLVWANSLLGCLR